MARVAVWLARLARWLELVKEWREPQAPWVCRMRLCLEFQGQGKGFLGSSWKQLVLKGIVAILRPTLGDLPDRDVGVSTSMEDY